MAILPQLVRRNVFITIASDEYRHNQPESRHEEYRLHPLFQSFLLRRFRADVGRAGVAIEQARVAGYFLGRGQWELAMPHLLAAEEFRQAAEVVAKNGAAWIASGALNSMSAAVDVLPAEALERHPRALSFRAEAARLCGEYDAAQAMLRRATTLLQAQGDSAGARRLQERAVRSGRTADSERK